MKGVDGGSVRIRQINRETVKAELAVAGRGTKAALAEATGLSIPTCANILADLMRTGEAVALDERVSQGGRPARVYALNPSHSMSAAIVVGSDGEGEYCRYAVVDSLGRAATRKRVSKKIDAGAIAALLADLRRAFPALKSAAVAIPGVFLGGRVGICDIAALEGVALEEMLRKRCAIEIAVENDMNLAAMGYYRKRSDLRESGIAYLVFPSGHCPGGGIITGGRLVRGKSAFAGEVSFIPPASGGKRRGQAKGRRLLALIAAISTSVIAVVNPEIVVLTGDLVAAGTGEAVRELCGQTIPEEHLPEFVAQPDYSGDLMAGTMDMAMGLISLDIRLVKRKRTWCDHG